MTDARPMRQDRFPTLWFVVSFLAIALFALAPMIGVLAAGMIAESNNCRLDEGSMHPCMVDGSDWGPMLYTLFVLGWFAIATIPLGLAALVIWLAVLLIFILMHLRRGDRA